MKNPFIISGLFFLFSIAFLFVFFNKTSRDLLVEQIQHRQQVSVRAGSKSIETLLDSIGKSLLIMSGDPNQERLNYFVKTWSSMGILGVTLTDKSGRVVRASNTIDIPDLGQNLSDRDYFKWARESKVSEFKAFEPIISRRGPSKGTYIIPVAVSLLSIDKKFNGVLVIGIPLSDLSRDYLNNMKISDSSKIYLVTNTGKIVYSDQPELAGKNFKDIFETDFLGKNKIIEILMSELEKNGESKLGLSVPNFQNDFILEPYLISAAPIQVSGQLWKVAVVTPETSLIAFTYKIFNSQILAVFIIATLLITLTLRIAKDTGYQEAVKTEHEIHNINS